MIQLLDRIQFPIKSRPESSKRCFKVNGSDGVLQTVVGNSIQIVAFRIDMCSNFNRVWGDRLHLYFDWESRSFVESNDRCWFF